MPRRINPLITHEYYHIFNRSHYRRPIFSRSKDISFSIQAFRYYTLEKPPVKFSYYRQSPNKYKLNFEDRIVSIIAYCIMPTHFHLLVRQEKDEGIRTSIQRSMSAYSHYYNIKYKKRGSLFESTFKSVRVESEEQLLHLSRYIHLNAATDYLVEKPEDYPYSSLHLFLSGQIPPPFDPFPIMTNFKKKEKYLEFLYDQKDYQRKLDAIKHLTLEE